MSGHASLPQHTAECALETEDMCPDTRPGHCVHRMQRRLASATPSLWQDGIVVAVDGHGRVDLALLDGRFVRVWNHSPHSVAVGEPVALHPLYHLVRAGSLSLNVLILR